VTGLKPSETIKRVARLAVLFCAAVLPVMLFVHFNAGSYRRWFIYALSVSIWALAVIAAGNVIMERGTAAGILARLRSLTAKKI